jgi:hypothetical protein
MHWRKNPRTIKTSLPCGEGTKYSRRSWRFLQKSYSGSRRLSLRLCGMKQCKPKPGLL